LINLQIKDLSALNVWSSLLGTNKNAEDQSNPTK